jgi:hypothetical protein
MIIEAGAASVIAMTAHSPFGETERSAGRWLPYLRLLAAIALAGLAILALQLGAVGENLNDGIAVLARNVIGFTGLWLLCSLVTGGLLAWTLPIGYMTFCQYALLEAWTAPWTWPVRPPADRGAWICACAVFAAGLLLFTIRGPAPASATTVREQSAVVHADGADPRCHLEHRKCWPTARLGREQRSVKRRLDLAGQPASSRGQPRLPNREGLRTLMADMGTAHDPCSR